MEILRPQVIVALGVAPLRAIGREVFHLEVPPTLSRCVEVYSKLPAAHGKVALVALTHPSFYFANVGRRRFLNYQGFDAEKAMVQRALQEHDAG
jgi:uracil-DNA glycosylase